MRFLTQTEFDEILRLHAEGVSQRQIAKQLGFNNATICRVVNGRSKVKDRSSREIALEFLKHNPTAGYGKIAAACGISLSVARQLVRRIRAEYTMLNTLSPQQVALTRMYTVITRFEYQKYETQGQQIIFNYMQQNGNGVPDWFFVLIGLPTEPAMRPTIQVGSSRRSPTPEEESALRWDAARRLAGLLDGGL